MKQFLKLFSAREGSHHKAGRHNVITTGKHTQTPRIPQLKEKKRPREWYNLDRQTTVWKWREIWRPVRKISFHFLIIFAVESPESLGGEWGRFIDCYRCGFVAEGGGGDGGGGGGADLLEILAPGSAREPSYRTFYVLLPGDSINLT